jgi:hypothetical protein
LGGKYIVVGTVTVSANSSLQHNGLYVLPGGRVTGPGGLGNVNGGVSVYQQDGTIDTAVYSMFDGYVYFASGTYGSAQFSFTTNFAKGIRFGPGATTIAGDIYLPALTVGSTMQNNLYGPSLVLKKSFKVDNLSNFAWNAGTGTIALAGTGAQNMQFPSGPLEPIVSSNTSSSGVTLMSSFSTPGLTLNAAALASSATMYFAGKSTFTVSTFTVTGDATHLAVLKSTASGTAWYLNNTSANSVTYAYVQDSSATNKTIFCSNCVDGGNNTNWNFGTGMTFTWTGAVNTDFGTGGNWSTGAVPRAVDDIVIASVTNNCVLDQNRTVNSVTTNAGAIFRLNNFNLTVSTYVVNSGTITATGTEQISLGGNWDNTSGTFNAASSTVTFNGATGVQLIKTGGTSAGKRFANLYYNGTSTAQVSGSDVYVSSNFSIGSAAVLFDDSVENRNFTILGDVFYSTGTLDLGTSTWTISGSAYYGRGFLLAFRIFSTIEFNGIGKSITLAPNWQTYIANGVIFSGSTTLNTSPGFGAVVTKLTASGTLTVSAGSSIIPVSMFVLPGGRITGGGSIAIAAAPTSISQQDGTIDISTYSATDGPVYFTSATYDMGAFIFGGTFHKGMQFGAGTTRINGNFTVTPLTAGTTMQNNLYGPTLVFAKNFTTAGPLSNFSWRAGTGTVILAGSAGQTMQFPSGPLEPIVSSNTSSGGVTFISTFTTPSITLNSAALGSSATMYFAGNSTFTVSTFTMTGSAGNMVVL